MTAIGFDQSKADPCVFRKVVDGEAEMVLVVHVDDILAHAKDKLKEMGDAKYYMGISLLLIMMRQTPMT